MNELMNILAIRNLENAELQHRHNIVRNPGNAFIELSEKQFIKIFRLSKELCRLLIRLLEPYIRPQRRETDLDVQSRVLAALKFYASGSYQPNIALNKYIDICQASVSRSIDEVTYALNHPEIFNQWVAFPDNFETLNRIRENSYNERHKQIRVKIERCNGVLKARFRCLLKHRVLHYKPRKASEIINACVVLDNLCIEYNIPLPENHDDDNIVVDVGIINDILEDQDQNVARAINPELADGQRARITVARSLRMPNQL